MNSKTKTALRLCVSTLIVLLAGCGNYQPRQYSIYCDNGFKIENQPYLRFPTGEIIWGDEKSSHTYNVPPGVTCTLQL